MVIQQEPVMKYDWNFSNSIFDSDPNIRAFALFNEAEQQFDENKFELARVTIERCLKITQYQDLNAFKLAIKIYKKSNDIDGIRNLWKRSAISDLLKNDYNGFLRSHFYSNYAEIFYHDKPGYEHTKIDEDLLGFMQLAVEGHPLKDRIKYKIKDYTKDQKLNIGIVLEGFSSTQAPIQQYRTLAKHYPKDKFNLFFYSRHPVNGSIGINENYEKVVNELVDNDCTVIYPSEYFGYPMDEVGFFANAIVGDEIDILIYQTLYFVPQFNFLSHLKPAPFQVATTHQQPEYCSHIDCVNTLRTFVPDQVVSCGKYLLSLDKHIDEPVQKRSDFGISEDDIVLISANRNMKYHSQNNIHFWQTLDLILNRYDNVKFIGLGFDGDFSSYPISGVGQKKTITLGYREDVVSFYKMADIYVDLFSHTSGGVMEAAYFGVPGISLSKHVTGAPFDTGTQDLTSDFLPDTELIIRHNDKKAFFTIIENLITDKAYRQKMGAIYADFTKKFKQETSVESFLLSLEENFWRKVSSYDRM